MSFQKRIIIEHTIKHIFTFIIVAFSWGPISNALMSAADSGKLESVAVVMGIVALSSISGYYAFSYTTVEKVFRYRFAGYMCTFFLGLAMVLSLVIVYFIAVIWIPEMTWIWALIMLSLYLGTLLFDYLDLMRIGMDVAAVDFYEKHGKSAKNFNEKK